MRVCTTVDASPKLRLALAIFIALVVWLAFLFALGHWLDATRSEPTPEKALEMRVVELDPEPATHAEPKQTQTQTPTPPPPAVKPSRPVAPRAHAMPGRTALPETPTPARHAPDATAPASAAPRPTSESPQSAANNATQEKQSTSPPATSPGDTAARSIAQPLPALPDDLRERAYQTVATARFVIHVDGSVDVELVKPTPDPRLNQLLLEALRKWRFFPALQGGHPVESRQDVRVHFNVN